MKKRAKKQAKHVPTSAAQLHRGDAQDKGQLLPLGALGRLLIAVSGYLLVFRRRTASVH